MSEKKKMTDWDRLVGMTKEIAKKANYQLGGDPRDILACWRYSSCNEYVDNILKAGAKPNILCSADDWNSSIYGKMLRLQSNYVFEYAKTPSGKVNCVKITESN